MDRIITLTTDFGTKDPWVGAVKGVILSINPRAVIVDISHEVAPQNILEGAFILGQACRHYPDGTIHMAVVDPGVGGERRGMLVETENYLFVGPDNGVFSHIIKSGAVKSAVHLTNKDYFRTEVSATFHARDIFAPVAAHLSLGVETGAFGPVLNDPEEIEIPSSEVTTDSLIGTIVYIDNFGNLITNISAYDMARLLAERGADIALSITVKGRAIDGFRTHYEESGKGEKGGAFALLGSTNHIEIASYSGSAAELLGAGAGDGVEVRVEKR